MVANLTGPGSPKSNVVIAQVAYPRKTALQALECGEFSPHYIRVRVPLVIWEAN
jgi:hypothetical protein